MDKLQALRVFVRVVDAGSFTRAAELLAMPKSAVTRQIQGLEQSLGITLLLRTSRRLSMTEQGAAYYQGATKLLAQVDMLDGSVTASALTPRGKLRVEMPNAIAYHLVIPALPDFLQRYPDLQVDLSVGNRAIDLIAKNVDCVIRVGAMMNDALIARSLGTLAMITCASPAYLRRFGTPLHPKELARDHTLVRIASPQTGKVFDHVLLRDGESQEISGRWQFSVNDSTAALTAARAGLGVLTTYAFLAKPSLEQGELRRLFVDWQGENISVHIAWPENRHLASKVRLFIDWIRDLFVGI